MHDRNRRTDSCRASHLQNTAILNVATLESKNINTDKINLGICIAPILQPFLAVLGADSKVCW
jgi:hypothetical protein